MGRPWRTSPQEGNRERSCRPSGSHKQLPPGRNHGHPNHTHLAASVAPRPNRLRGVRRHPRRPAPADRHRRRADRRRRPLHPGAVRERRRHTGFVAEAAPIPDAAQQFAEVVLTTDKVATIGKYSFETLQQPEAARLVVESLSRSVTRSANAAYLNSASAPSGLLTTAGIVDGGTVGTNLDELVDAVSGIESDGGAATHVIASPNAWAALSKLKTATDSEANLLGAGLAAGQRSLLGVPVLVSADMPSNKLLVLDKSAVIAAQSPVRLTRSEDAYFANDVVGIKVIWRIGWAVDAPGQGRQLTTT